MEKLIEVQSLVKNFNGNAAVDSVSFDILAGEIFGLLGPNGAGKSTTISILCGLLKPDEGEVLINGESIRKNSMALKALLGLVPQDIALYPTLTARENLKFWAKMYGLRGKSVKDRTEEVLEIVGLSDRGNDRIDSYSGGMKRRINIAAALVHKPKVLIMDEPTVGIDPQSRNHILETVIELNKEGMTVIYTSHYMEEVEKLCNRVAIMDHGKVIALGTKEELSRLDGDNNEITIETKSLDGGILTKVQGLSGVIQATIEDENSLHVIVTPGAEVMAELVRVLGQSGTKISNIKIKEPNLETVFLHLTGRALRD